MTFSERILYVILALGLTLGLGASIFAPDLFVTRLSAEDGLFEWATAIALLLGSVVCLTRVKLANKARIFALVSAFGAVILFFGAGEEISWGQRLIGWESGDFWLENNDQAETNLHNLVVGEVKINKLLFGVALTLAFVLYFAVLPLLHHRGASVSAWADRWGVPVPKWHHGVAFIVSLIVMTLVPTSRSAELGEFAVGILLATVVLSPKNARVFK
ncbi:MAG: hypothetical protein ABJL99_01090 [Aliishimia sp.]